MIRALLACLAFAASATAAELPSVLLKAADVAAACSRLPGARCTPVTATAAYVDGVALSEVRRLVPEGAASLDAPQGSTSSIIHPGQSVRTVPDADLSFDFLGVSRCVPPAVSTQVQPPTRLGRLQTNAPYQLEFLNSRQRSRCRTLRVECRFLPQAFLYSHTGAGTRLYVVGSGIRADHYDFATPNGGTRVSPDKYEGVSLNRSCAYWQATHAASLAAGGVYGVAKEAEIVQVAVKQACRVPTHARSILEGLAWVKRHAAANPAPTVVLVIAKVSSKDALVAEVLDDAARELTAAGLLVVTGAGLNKNDACAFSPGRVPEVLTVGAARVVQLPGKVVAIPAEDSNFGRCVDLWAPGWLLEGAFGADVDTTAVLSGSPQAAGLAAGVAAVLRQRFPLDAPAAIIERIHNASSAGYLVFPLVDTSDQVLQSPVE